MPGGGGREVLRYLCETGGDRPAVIMITGLADEQLFSELMDQGVSRCLSKPFRLAMLLSTIEDVLAGKAAREARDALPEPIQAGRPGNGDRPACASCQR